MRVSDFVQALFLLICTVDKFLGWYLLVQNRMETPEQYETSVQCVKSG